MICEVCGEDKVCLATCAECDLLIYKKERKQGALEELKQLVDLMKFNQQGESGFWSVEVWIKNIEKRIKELEGKDVKK